MDLLTARLNSKFSCRFRDWLQSIIIFSSVACSHVSFAQVVSDGSLSTQVSTINQRDFVITGGSPQGGNLFHSFTTFSIPDSGGAHFNNSVDIERVISRVTGGRLSSIEGLISTQGSADFFLLNPNGIVFGPSARLAIGGSFIASTAEQLNFADGFTFSTTSPDASLLTIAIPVGLQFGSDAASIRSQSARLRLQSQQTLGLLGGDVVLEDSIVRSPQGRVEIGSVAANSVVSLSPITQGWNFGYENVQDFGFVGLRQETLVSTSRARPRLNESSGDIILRGNVIELSGSSDISSRHLNTTQGGGITLKASELITISNSVVASVTLATGAGGNITIEAPQFFQFQSFITSSSFDAGQAGLIVLNVDDLILLRGEGSLSEISSESFSEGDAGNIEINTRNLVLQDGGVIETSTSSIGGNGGQLVVNASESIVLEGQWKVLPSDVEAGPTSLAAVTRGSGNGGTLEINTQQLLVESGASVAVSAQDGSLGQAGSLIINAAESIILRGLGNLDGEPTSLAAFSASPEVAGDVQLATQNLIVEDGAQINISSTGIGSAGTLEVPGTEMLIIQNGGTINASSLGAGSAGTLDLNTETLIVQKGGAINLSSTGMGAAGNLNINADQVLLDDGTVNLSSTGMGAAGNLNINADQILLDRGLLTATTQAGQGNITIDSELLVLRDNSLITTNASGEATGGNITIETDVLTAIPSENSDISANAEDSFGGRVQINATGVFGLELQNSPTPRSDITASSQLGAAFSGEVLLNTPEVDISRSLANFPTDVVDRSQQIIAGCPAADGNRFVVTGRGGLPPDPRQFLPEQVILQVFDLAADPSFSRTSEPGSQAVNHPSDALQAARQASVPFLQEAETWQLNEAGKVELVAKTVAEELLHEGQNHYKAGRFSQAVEMWQQAVEMFEHRGDRYNQIVALNSLSVAHQSLGQWETARTTIAHAFFLLQSQHDPLLYAQILDTLGSWHLHIGDPEAALERWQQAEAIYRSLQPTQHHAQALPLNQINQTQALRSLGFYRRAQQLIESVNQALTTQPDSLLKVRGLQSLGLTLRMVGDVEESQQVLQRAMALAQRLDLDQVLPALQLSLAHSAIALNQLDTALIQYQKIQKTANLQQHQIEATLGELSAQFKLGNSTASPNHLTSLSIELLNLPASRWSSYAQIYLATTLIDQNIAGQAVLQLLHHALHQGQILDDQRVQSYALGQIGLFYETTGQWSEALGATQEALVRAATLETDDLIALWQWQQGRILQRQVAESSLVAQTPEVHMLKTLPPEQDQAIRTLQTQALNAYDQAVQALGHLRQDLVAMNPEVQFSFRDQIEPIYRDYVRLLLQDLERLPTSTQQQRLHRAREVIEALQLAELENFFRESCQTYQPRSIETIDANAAVIYTIVLDQRLEVILSLPGQPLVHYGSRINHENPRRFVREINAALRLIDLPNAILPYAQDLYDALIRPAQKFLAQQEIETLVFVLDNVLRGIPMAILHNGSHYIVEDYNIALTPGLQLLATADRSTQQPEILLGGLTEARQGFIALPNVQRELDNIATYSPNQRLLNPDFNDRLIQTYLNTDRFEVVHFATHGQFSSKAEDTFLLTWDDRLDVNELDQFLGQRRDRKPIDLLVLSACETAAGDDRAALGLAGMAIRSGARSTLATLWAVEDHATADLVSEFYRHLLQEKRTNAEALRQAQRALLQHPHYQHPYYWASFVLIGDWQ